VYRRNSFCRPSVVCLSMTLVHPTHTVKLIFIIFVSRCIWGHLAILVPKITTIVWRPGPARGRQIHVGYEKNRDFLLISCLSQKRYNIRP